MRHTLNPRSVRDPSIHLIFLALLCLLGFGRGFGRYFVSEDFFVLRRLMTSSLWETTWLHLTGPLLEISFVKFYRPVSGFLLHLETLVWGTWPAGYLGTHLAIHVLNACLVHRLALRWGSGCKTSAFGVALIFAVYPLHTNAVLFVSSFATLFSTTFFLAALWFYERYRDDGDRPGPRRLRSLAASLGSFCLALGSYEQTVILPGFLVARELLETWVRHRQSDWREKRRKSLTALAPVILFFAVLGSYFLVRRAALDQLIAGYDSFRHRMLPAQLIQLGRSLLEGLANLIYPVFSQPVTGFAALGVGGLLIFFTVAALRRLRREGRQADPSDARLWLLGLLWILASQAPFAFAEVIPGNGRYWYLTSIGLGLAIVAAMRFSASGLGTLFPNLGAPRTVAILCGLVGPVYFALLIQNVDRYAEAGHSSRTLQSRLLGLRQDKPIRVFVAGHPDFIRNAREIPVAQVFHWGLHDALAPPFVDGGLAVYPLPRLEDTDLLPIAERPDLGSTWRYDATSETLTPVRKGSADLARIETRETAEGGWQFRLAEGHHRLVLITPGGSSLYSINPGEPSGTWIDISPPEAVVESMHHLYGDGDLYAWIEARQPGRLVAVSDLLFLEPAD